MMNLCKLLGHKVKSYDDQYPVCARCGAHGYYDSHDFDPGFVWWPCRLWWWVCDLPRKIHEIRERWEQRGQWKDEIPF